MDSHSPSIDPDPALVALMEEVAALRDAVAAEAGPLSARLGASPALDNLACYLRLRRRDLRPLQRRLMARGLSSLGRLESRVLPTLDAVAASLALMTGRAAPRPAPDEAAFFAGEARLAEAAEALLGPQAPGRRGRIMVTLPSVAADDPAFVADLLRRGMDAARINCAHDGPEAWRRMAGHVRAAAARQGRPVRVMMDIAGPKIRTGAVAQLSARAKMTPGDALRLMARGDPRPDEVAPFSAVASLPEIVERLRVGERVLYNDGKLEAAVEAITAGEALLRVRRAQAGGAKLKAEKGLNLPDTALGLSPLTAKDEADLVTVIECADMIGYSFVSRPDDIDLLEAALARAGHAERPLGLVAKVERPEAVHNLPELIARAAGRRPLGVMIARGDLAAEIGFDRLAEMQEEILWLCEAAAVPAIWATQVLEALVKRGAPSRGEMTDAAMAARAECVMLNKGPWVGEGIDVLERLLTRMDAHVHKKTPTLRALGAW